jgi:hypothetical protein
VGFHFVLHFLHCKFFSFVFILQFLSLMKYLLNI